MKYFLDANICIYFLNNKFPAVKDHIFSKKSSRIALPALVVAELRYGAEKSRYTKTVFEKLNRFLSKFKIIPFDNDAAAAYAQIRSDLEKKGKPIGPNDLIIAATALAQNATLVTHNIKEYSRVKGLRTEDWTV